MRMKLNLPILGLFDILEGLAKAPRKIVSQKFTAREYSACLKQTPASPEKKARRKMVQASQRRNRI